MTTVRALVLIVVFLVAFTHALLGVDVNVPIEELAFTCMKQQNATAFVM